MTAINWNDIAAKVIALGAPLLGEALGGPLGGAAGKVLAEALGSDETPAAVNNAVSKTDPAAVAVAASAARAAESEWLARLAEIGKEQVTQVNQTMRSEAASEDALQKCWRPLYALELILECPAFAVALGHGLWSGEPQIINGFANLSGLIMAYMAARFGVLGVYVSGRSREKQAMATGQATPTLVGALVKTIAGRK